MGYRSKEIHELFRTQDWGVTLTDKVGPEFIPYATRMYRKRYILNIPFHYENSTFEHRLIDQARYAAAEGDKLLGARESGFESQFGANTFASSLPSGFANGFNVNNLLSSLTVGYQDSISFSKLPIPFVCVASDMISCKEKNWGSGSVTTAMRSTMSIPGLFNPVRSEGMILVDGGTRNNFPTDIATAAGADYIIGVELSDLDPGYSQVNNLGNIVSQFIKMLGKDSYDRNVNVPDVFVKPEISEFNMLSFKPEAIDTMIDRGYRAMLEQKDGIAEIGKRTGYAGGPPSGRKAIDISRIPVLVSSVLFEGVDSLEAKMLSKRIKLNGGSRLGKQEIDAAASRIQATGCFDAVTYALLGSEEPFTLVFRCTKGPVNNFGFGMRIDNVEWASFLLNAGFGTHRLMGTRVDFEAKIGKNQAASLRYSLDLPWIPTVNFEASLSNRSGYIYDNAVSSHFKVPENTIWDMQCWGHTEQIYLSNLSWTKFNFKAGVQNRYLSISNGSLYGQSLSQVTGGRRSGDYIGAFVNGALYSMDDPYFPTSGVDFKFGGEYDFIQYDYSEFPSIADISTSVKGAFPAGKFLTVLPEFHFRHVIGNEWRSTNSGLPEKGVSLLHANYIGGAIAGRYIDHQVPFFGMNDIYRARNFMTAFSLEFRANPFRNTYISAVGAYLKDADTLYEALENLAPTMWAAGLEAAYNTVAGPLKARLSWSDRCGWNFYVSFGYDF